MEIDDFYVSGVILLKMGDVLYDADPQNAPWGLLHQLLHILGPFIQVNEPLELLVAVRDHQTQSFLVLLLARKIDHETFIHSILDGEQLGDGIIS